MTSTVAPSDLRHRAHYAVLGRRATVVSNDVGLIADLDRLNQFFRLAELTGPIDSHYEAVAYEEGRLWEITVDGEELTWRHGRLAAAGEIEWHLINAAIEARPDLLHLHAALLAGPHCSLLLPGGGGIGKTTLALALTLRGLRLYADDVALLRPADGRPLPCPRALHVHDDALATLTALGLRYDPADHLGPYLCPRVGAPWPTRPGPPLGLVVILAPAQPDGPTALAPITQAEAAVEMLRVSKNLDHFPRRGLDLLPRLLAGVACYRLERSGDIGAAAALVHQLVAAHRPAGT